MNNVLKFGLLVIYGVSLTACVAQKHTGDTFGSAVRANQQAQVYNPDAAKGEVHAVMLDGQKAEQVINGYRKEKGDADTGKLIEGLSR